MLNLFYLLLVCEHISSPYCVRKKLCKPWDFFLRGWFHMIIKTYWVLVRWISSFCPLQSTSPHSSLLGHLGKAADCCESLCWGCFPIPRALLSACVFLGQAGQIASCPLLCLLPRGSRDWLVFIMRTTFLFPTNSLSPHFTTLYSLF